MAVTSDQPQVATGQCTAQESAILAGPALEAWRSYLQSHAAILRELDAEMTAAHGMTARDYEVLLYLAQAEDRKLPMSALAERTRLTRSGITRLVDGLVAQRLIVRISCKSDARISYARLTDTGFEKLERAGHTHVAGIDRLFLAHFSAGELESLASLLGRLPGPRLDGDCTVS
jgi:DNA-binding MarR family transcriptional regulator